MTEMSEVSRQQTPDEQFAENALHSAAERGIYVELGYVINPDTLERAYYAMTMPASAHQELLDKCQDEQERQNQEAVTGGAVRPLNITVPMARLPQPVFASQPTYVEGCDSRKDALKASMWAFHKIQREIALKTPCEPARRYLGQSML